jgi:glycosyltransferase involved in cell wall biosynthesis
MQKNPLISVIIPAHNEEAFIRKCLDSLSKQTLEKKLFEVIVINNASKDGTAGIARKYNVRVINEERKSVVLARQKGVKEKLSFLPMQIRFIPKIGLKR